MKKGVIVAMLLFFLLVMGTAFSGNHDNNKNNEKVDSEVEDALLFFRMGDFYEMSWRN